MIPPVIAIRSGRANQGSRPASQRACLRSPNAVTGSDQRLHSIAWWIHRRRSGSRSTRPKLCGVRAAKRPAKADAPAVADGLLGVLVIGEAPNWDDTYDADKGYLTYDHDTDPTARFLRTLRTSTPLRALSSYVHRERTRLLSSSSLKPWTLRTFPFRGLLPTAACSRAFASPSPLPSRFCTLPYMLVAWRRHRPAWQLWSDGIRTRQMTLLYFR
jgi:hypothetical protein